MRGFVALVCVQALDSSRAFLHRQLALEAAVLTNGTNATGVAWDSYVGDYCGAFCSMKGVDSKHCTLCAQRLNFTVEEGKVACRVKCEIVQTDHVTEEAVSCEERLDKCMFQDVDAGECKLECGTASGAAASECATNCSAFKATERAAGRKFSTFFGDHTVARVEEQEVNGTNGTTLENVTVHEVVSVEPLPVATPGDRVHPIPQAAYRFAENETAWVTQPQTYCGSWYCNAEAAGVAGVDAYHCVECVNRLNNSVEAGLGKCRVECEMTETDAAGADFKCDSCMQAEFDTGTCYLECALPRNKAVPDCMGTCEKSKAEQRAAGKEVRPFGWPAPVEANATEANTTK